MHLLISILHILVCIFLIIVVLLQSGKAADLAGAFGGMGSQTAFGPRGAATVLSKATTAAAVVFMITSIILSIMATKQGGVGGSVLERNAGAATSRPASGKTAPVQVPVMPGQPITIPVPQQGGNAPTQGQPAPAAPAKK